jgi:hypothetical protein
MIGEVGSLGIDACLCLFIIYEDSPIEIPPGDSPAVEFSP